MCSPEHRWSLHCSRNSHLAPEFILAMGIKDKAGNCGDEEYQHFQNTTHTATFEPFASMHGTDNHLPSSLEEDILSAGPRAFCFLATHTWYHTTTPTNQRISPSKPVHLTRNTSQLNDQLPPMLPHLVVSHFARHVHCDVPL